MDTGPALIDGSPGSQSGRRFQPEGSARAAECDITLSLPARADGIGLVRHVAGALAEAAGLDARGVDDVRLAVTEACTNVVRHAYVDGTGRIELSARADANGLLVEVCDSGVGLQPRPSEGVGGLGLPLMVALAKRFEIDRDGEAGTRVSMSFPLAV